MDTRPDNGLNSRQDAEVNGVRLAYREHGTGEPVVFVHGSLSDLRTWQAQVPAIGASHRAITYSRRYALPGPDIPAGTDDRMAPHVEDLVAFLHAVDAVPAHLVGNSWGAFICLLTAVRHPEVVRSVVLEEPPVLSLFVSSPPRPAELLRLLARRPRTAVAVLRFGGGTMAPAQRAFRAGRNERAMLAFVHGILGSEAYAAVPESRREQMRGNVGALRAQLLGEGFPPLADDEVRGVRVPVLLVTGEQSPPFLLRLTDRLQELLPNVERADLPAAGHLMHEQNAPALNAAVLAFLAGHAR